MVWLVKPWRVSRQPGLGWWLLAAVMAISNPACRDSQHAASRVAGLSMAPGLVDGDQILWEPRGSGRLKQLDRVVCRLADGAWAVKRLVARGGERVCVERGELLVAGQMVEKTPPQLAELATALGAGGGGWASDSPAWQRSGAGWQWTSRAGGPIEWLTFSGKSRKTGQPAGVFYDESPWLERESRRLEQARDIGLLVVARLKAADQVPGEVIIQVGEQATRLVPRGAGRFACVTGRLDGRYVAAAWPLPDREDRADRPVKLLGRTRQLFPQGLPARWQATAPAIDADGVAPIRIGVRGPARFLISRLLLWRDVHWLPHGRQSCWDVPAGHVFLLGDCPAASRDSRQWGPLPAEAVLGRVLSRR